MRLSPRYYRVMTPFEIVATLGPASWESARELIDAGAIALRINGSHALLEEVRDTLDASVDEVWICRGDLEPRGYAGIVLSDEAAVGAHPVHAMRTARGSIETFSR